MSKTNICPLCNSEVTQKSVSYNSNQKDLQGNEIIVPNVSYYTCNNTECEHSWLPNSEEEKIDLYVLKKSRYFLSPEQIRIIRESLGFSTKTAASNFLTLNSKAFTKWENGYTDPNTANDLLIRLAVFSESNFNFIKALKTKKFAFDPCDYELICSMSGEKWNYQEVKINQVSNSNYTHKCRAPNNDLYSKTIRTKISDVSQPEFTDCKTNGKVA